VHGEGEPKGYSPTDSQKRRAVKGGGGAEGPDENSERRKGAFRAKGRTEDLKQKQGEEIPTIPKRRGVSRTKRGGFHFFLEREKETGGERKASQDVKLEKGS